jgi:hypothetical protein
MSTHITHSVDTDGAVTVTVNGGVELAPVRERLLLFLLAEKQWTHMTERGTGTTRTRAIIPGAPVNADLDADADEEPGEDATDPGAFVAPDTTDGDAEADAAPPARARRTKAKVAEPARGERTPYGGIADRIITALRAHAPCSPKKLWAACGLKSGPGPQHRTELHRLMAEGRVVADGKTTNRTLTLAEGE